MDIYFVRHGQTGGNVARRHQAEHTPLTELGQQQAAAVATELAALKPTHLLSSHLIRAIETARPISAATNLEIELEHNLTELYRPRYLEGKFHFSPQSIFYYVLWFLGIENKALAGESYHQVRQRIAVLKNIFKQYPPDARIVVVSHSVFMNLFVAHMCRARALNVFTLLGFLSKLFRFPNASVVHIRYEPTEGKTCDWHRVEKE